MSLSGAVGVEIDEVSLSVPCLRSNSTGQLRVTQFPPPHGRHLSHLGHKFSSESPEFTSLPAVTQGIEIPYENFMNDVSEQLPIFNGE